MNLADQSVFVTAPFTMLGNHINDALRNHAEQQAINLSMTYPLDQESNDLRVAANALRLIRGKQVVIHTSRIREEGANVLAACLRHNVRKLVIVGNGVPDIPPKRGKRLSIVRLVPCELYGKGDICDPRFGTVVPSFIRHIAEAVERKRETVLLPGNPHSAGDFLYGGDVAQAVLRAIEHDPGREPLPLSSGRYTDFATIAGRVALLLNYHGKLEWTGGPLLVPPAERPDCSRTANAIGWLPGLTPLTEGLSAAVGFYNEVLKGNGDDDEAVAAAIDATDEEPDASGEPEPEDS